MVKRRRDKRIWLVILGVFVAVFLFAFLAQRSRKVNEDVSAASLANFDPGYIISDYQMGNYNSMSEAEIQAFLTAKNPCSNTDYNYYKSLMAQYNGRVTWHWANGHFVCLSEEKFGDGEAIGSGETAAHIIWQAAQDYKINPQVLIVLLQKEQGLITDPIPNSVDYRAATGYGCPDTAACSSKYYGFKNQVRNAASLFRTVLNGGWTNYPLGENYIQYSPTASCGGSVVNVRNLATSALYRYTPYQPNAGALAAGYGTAYCGAYGNRNFYLYFQDWFGDITRSIESNIYFPNGNYKFYTAIDEEYALDVYGATAKDGGNVQIWKQNESGAQTFKLEYDERTKLYKIVNSSGKVLDAENEGVKKGANVYQWTSSDNSCSQKWALQLTGDYYRIVSACSGLVLDVANGESENGANVLIWTENGGLNQRWKIIKSGAPIIKEGLYTIHSKDGLSLDVYGGYKNSGANIQLWSAHDDSNEQKFKFILNEDGTYNIADFNSDKYLDVNGAKAKNKTNIQLWTFSGTCAQKWILEKNDNGYYIASSCDKDFVLDIDGAKQERGTNIQLWTKNSSVAQRWYLNSVMPVVVDGEYRIAYAADTTKSLDIHKASKEDGAIAQLWDNNDSGAQAFLIERQSDGYYAIKNINSGKYLDVAQASVKSGAKIQQWTKNNTCAQKWEIKLNKNKSYYLVNVCGKKALDLNTGVVMIGEKIQVWDKNSSKAQEWVLLPL